MKTETIEKVLKIAIDNGYKPIYEHDNFEDSEQIIIDGTCFRSGTIGITLITMITSKEFIDAFAKYLWDNKIFCDMSTGNFIKYNYIDDRDDELEIALFRGKISDAIYNSTLEEFFTGLIK